MVEAVDENVGRIIQTLEKEGLLDNTIIVFTSDNGGLSVKEGKFTPSTTNAPLKAGKGFIYEGGIRVPLIIPYPELGAGKETEAVVTGTDFLPTLLDLCGIKDENTHEGVSISQLLTNESQTRSLFWHYPHYNNRRKTSFSD